MPTDDATTPPSLDRFLRAVDHDLRVPVSNILGFVDLLRETPGAAYNAEQLEFLRRIEDNCQTLLVMFGELRKSAGQR